VAAGRVCEQFIEQIAPARPIPQMVVRIDDRQVGLEDLFLAARQPVAADGKIVRLFGGGRGWRPLNAGE
jgi:hypothetical protein